MSGKSETEKLPGGETSNSGPIPAIGGAMAGDMPNAGHQYVVARESRNQFESFQDRFSDFCSSILVKETRQAIKSRQFFLTFMVLIVLVALWTFYALSPGRDNYSVDSLGAYTLHGFLYVLGLPLCLIIPFTTFRSLAQEYEDGTIQMILITTMRPYQIVAGKLGSAMLQVLVYLAVLGPCISFCYLLRGVDVTQILMSISLAVVTSFGLCCAAIGLAGGAKTRRTGQGLSLLLIMALAIVSFWWCMLAYGICFEPAGVLMEGFSVIAFGPLAGWLSTALLLFVAAAAQISFPSSNRSTMIRVVLLIQTVLFLAWYIAICSMTGFHEQGFMVASCFAMQYWLLVGAMMVGCHSGLSPRVRRTLPSGFLKRSVVSLFMPGPGRAYLFTVGAAFSVAVCLAVLALGNDLFQRDFESSETFGSRNTFSATDCRRALGGIFANWIYFLLFFSVLFLFSRLVARGRMFREPFFLLMAIIAVAMVFLVTVGSYTIDPYVFNSSSGGFEPSQLFNWYRIQALAADRGAETVAGELSIITVLAVPLFLVCFWIAARDLLAEKAFVPQRVLEEDEEKRKQNLAREYDDETIDEIFAAVRPGQSPDTL